MRLSEKDKDARIVELYKAGWSFRQLQKRYHRSPNYIAKLVKGIEVIGSVQWWLTPIFKGCNIGAWGNITGNLSNTPYAHRLEQQIQFQHLYPLAYTQSASGYTWRRS